MRGRRGRLTHKPQSDPSSREMALGAIILVFRQSGRIDHFIGEPGVAEVEQFAGDQPALYPPLIRVAKSRGIMRRRQQQLSGLDDLVGTPQPLDAAELVAR